MAKTPPYGVIALATAAVSTPQIPKHCLFPLTKYLLGSPCVFFVAAMHTALYQSEHNFPNEGEANVEDKEDHSG